MLKAYMNALCKYAGFYNPAHEVRVINARI